MIVEIIAPAIDLVSCDVMAAAAVVAVGVASAPVVIVEVVDLRGQVHRFRRFVRVVTLAEAVDVVGLYGRVRRCRRGTGAGPGRPRQSITLIALGLTVVVESCGAVPSVSLAPFW